MDLRRLFGIRKAVDCQPKTGKHDTGDDVEKTMRCMEEEKTDIRDDYHEYEEAK